MVTKTDTPIRNVAKEVLTGILAATMASSAALAEDNSLETKCSGAITLSESNMYRPSVGVKLVDGPTTYGNIGFDCNNVGYEGISLDTFVWAAHDNYRNRFQELDVGIGD